MSNRSAVFGGAGFIGTNLVYQLIEDGQQVFNFDNLSGLGNLLNIAELMQQSRHSFARCDISNPEEIRQALLMAAADTIYFCITPKNPEEESSLENFRTFFETVKEWRNGMADTMRLNEIIDRSNLIAISKKQAEYLALQNQINPHFLYNTLEGIRSEALIAGLDSIAEMTEALATFFRYTISDLENLVTLEDELANIENYYYIQQFRFGSKLDLSIRYERDGDDDFSEMDFLQCKLPKLTLQPIVENSIYHGIERKIGKGHLVIRISASEERLYIRISDDGQGMTDAKLKELNEKLRRLGDETDDPEKDGEKKQTRGGIAVVNVNRRIKLLFGEEYGIHVYSKEEVGTDVVVELPLVREENRQGGWR